MENLIKEILQKEKIRYENLEKSEAGFSNEVYFIDDKLVLKIAKENKNYKLKKEIDFYKNIALDCIPKYISSGICNNREYLLIEKLEGKSLYNLWHTFCESKRREIIYSICEILKKLNNQNGNFLDEKYKNEDWLEKWRNSFSLNIQIIKEKGFDTFYLEDFKNNRLDTIMKEQNIKLVYNDAHFDNFILSNEKLYIIDFDRVFLGSLDYELLIIDSMLDNPFKFASLEEEKLVKEEDYKNIRMYLKEFYKELYNFEYIDERIFIYKFIYNLSHAFSYNRNDWLEEQLLKFKNYFYKNK